MMLMMMMIKTLVLRRCRIRLRWLTGSIVGLIMVCILPYHPPPPSQLLLGSYHQPSAAVRSSRQQQQQQQQQQQIIQDNALFEQRLQSGQLGRCAIHLYGLPRAFASLVLPSFVKHVVQPNARYQCDYFVHYYNCTTEAAGRSGQGGSLDPHEEIHLLTAAVAEAAAQAQQEQSTTNNTVNNNTTVNNNNTVNVHYAMDQEADFWQQHATFLHKIHTAVDAHGRLLYHPWKDASYTATTLDNIVKMWHSIQASWHLMMETQEQQQEESANDATTTTTKLYTRVAMLRSDVVYMTPVDIWERGGGGGGASRPQLGRHNHHYPNNNPKKHYDVDNTHAVLAGFAKYPVNDRMIYGPTDVVRIWAATRFDFVDAHVQWCATHLPGMGMHSETFVQRLLLSSSLSLSSSLEQQQQQSSTSAPAVVVVHNHTQQPYVVEEHATLCFLRARVDESVWFQDCDGAPRLASPYIQLPKLSLRQRRQKIEQVVGRPCQRPRIIQTPTRNKAVSCPA